MAYALGLDVEQRAAVGLQGVADVGDRAAGRPHDLPVSAAGGQQLCVEVGARCVAAGKRNDPPVALWGVTEVDGYVQLGVEPVDVAQLGVGEGVHRGSFRRSRVSALRPTNTASAPRAAGRRRRPGSRGYPAARVMTAGPWRLPTHAADRAGSLGCSASAVTDRKSTRLNSSHSQISYAV